MNTRERVAEAFRQHSSQRVRRVREMIENKMIGEAIDYWESIKDESLDIVGDMIYNQGTDANTAVNRLIDKLANDILEFEGINGDFVRAQRIADSIIMEESDIQDELEVKEAAYV
jgi:AAA15 family ATPase/GTPase